MAQTQHNLTSNPLALQSLDLRLAGPTPTPAPKPTAAAAVSASAAKSKSSARKQLFSPAAHVASATPGESATPPAQGIQAVSQITPKTAHKFKMDEIQAKQKQQELDQEKRRLDQTDKLHDILKDTVYGANKANDRFDKEHDRADKLLDENMELKAKLAGGGDTAQPVIAGAPPKSGKKKKMPAKTPGKKKAPATAKTPAKPRLVEGNKVKVIKTKDKGRLAIVTDPTSNSAIEIEYLDEDGNRSGEIDTKQRNSLELINDEKSDGEEINNEDSNDEEIEDEDSE